MPGCRLLKWIVFSHSLSISMPNSIIVSAISGLIPVMIVEQPNNLIPFTILNRWLTTAVST